MNDHCILMATWKAISMEEASRRDKVLGTFSKEVGKAIPYGYVPLFTWKELRLNISPIDQS